jgi:hypothetical protein
MSDAPPATVKKIQTLVQIAEDLRHGKHFEITRLTILKGLCSDPKAAAQFALHLAKKTQQAMKARGCPRYTEPEDWQQYRRLVGSAVRRMTSYLKKQTKQAESSLYELLSEIQDVQNEYDRQRWGPVRIIHSREVLMAETALECVLNPWASSDRGYLLARRYAERYNSRYGTGLIPESATMVEDIAEFWGRSFSGRGWRRRLTE